MPSAGPPGRGTPSGGAATGAALTKGVTIPPDIERHPSDPAAGTTCLYCGGEARPDSGRLTLWTGDKLVVIDDVPASVCAKCGEEYYDESVLARVERIRLKAADTPAPVRTMKVPVYAWEDL